MNVVVDYLLWPVAVFLQAICGILDPAKTPEKAAYQRIARLSLLASVVVFGMAFPLSLLSNSVIGIKPPLAVGVVLLVLFVVFGNLADTPPPDDEF
jgi:hypothetical protein